MFGHNAIQSVLHLMFCGRDQCCLSCPFVAPPALAAVNAFQQSIVGFDVFMKIQAVQADIFVMI